MEIPADISQYILSLIGNVYDQYSWASTTKQIYDSVQSWRAKYWMIGDITLSSVCVSLSNLINNNEDTITIKSSQLTMFIAINACRVRNYMIVTRMTDINKWLALFIKLNMYTEDVTSKVLCVTTKNKVHSHHVLVGNDTSNQIIITNITTMSNIPYKKTKHIIIDSDNNYINEYKSLTQFTKGGNIKIIKGSRDTYNVNYNRIIIKYEEDMDLYQFGNKILDINILANNTYNNTYIQNRVTIAEFNNSSKCIISGYSFEITNYIYPDAIVSLGHKFVLPSNIRSYTKNNIPYYILCKTDYDLFTTNITVQNINDPNTYLLWIIVNLMNVDICGLTKADYQYLLSIRVQYKKYIDWDENTSAFTRVHLDMFEGYSNYFSF